MELPIHTMRHELRALCRKRISCICFSDELSRYQDRFPNDWGFSEWQFFAQVAMKVPNYSISCAIASFFHPIDLSWVVADEIRQRIFQICSLFHSRNRQSSPGLESKAVSVRKRREEMINSWKMEQNDLTIESFVETTSLYNRDGSNHNITYLMFNRKQQITKHSVIFMALDEKENKKRKKTKRKKNERKKN